MTGKRAPGKAGIIPRTLDVIFNSIDNVADLRTFFPKGRNSFGVRDVDDATLQHLPDLQASADEIKIDGFDRKNACSVFISYVEIYKNVCFDLLKKPSADGNLIRCEVKEDAFKRAYVDGAIELEVGSSSDALLALASGDARRHRSATALNTDSSRSHAICTVKLVMAPRKNPTSPFPVTDPSQLCMVDLAGSERQQRTKNVGERLADASSVNQSLVVLRRCIHQLRDNQRARRVDRVPFREAKLTHLFKNFFEGGGKIRMILCARPGPDDFLENQSILEFGEKNQEVAVTESTSSVQSGRAVLYEAVHLGSGTARKQNEGQTPLHLQQQLRQAREHSQALIIVNEKLRHDINSLRRRLMETSKNDSRFHEREPARNVETVRPMNRLRSKSVPRSLATPSRNVSTSRIPLIVSTRKPTRTGAGDLLPVAHSHSTTSTPFSSRIQ